jgi:hypothetical protein
MGNHPWEVWSATQHGLVRFHVFLVVVLFVTLFLGLFGPQGCISLRDNLMQGGS